MRLVAASAHAMRVRAPRGRRVLSRISLPPSLPPSPSRRVQRPHARKCRNMEKDGDELVTRGMWSRC